MISWKLIDKTAVPLSGTRLFLYRRGNEFSIRGERFELMNSRVHGSEEALARLACQRISRQIRPRVLIGGLGMGYTLSAALKEIGTDGRVVVAELVPAVVAWNRGPLGHLAGNPLVDARVIVFETDVAAALQFPDETYDAIILDVDNGPDGLTRPENDWIYSSRGLKAAYTALRPGGVLAVWSAAPDSAFTIRLRRAGFAVKETFVPVRNPRKGGRHMIWLADRS